MTWNGFHIALNLALFAAAMMTLTYILML